MTWRSLGDSNPCFRRERAIYPAPSYLILDPNEFEIPGIHTDHLCYLCAICAASLTHINKYLRTCQYSGASCDETYPHRGEGWGEVVTVRANTRPRGCRSQSAFPDQEGNHAAHQSV